MTKPKGWYHRYEITRRPVTFHPTKPPKDWWCIVHYFGRNKGAGVRYMEGDPGPDATDEVLIRRSDCNNAIVPVYVVRNGIIGEPYFGKYYGQK